MRGLNLLIIILGLFLLTISCKERPNVLSEDKLIDILVDYHMAEGVVFSPDRHGLNHIQKLEVYNYVFEKYDISKEYFDSSLNYYITKPKEFQDLYGKVIAKLRLIETDINSYKYTSPDLNRLSNLPTEIKKVDSLERDSVVAEIWPLMRNYELPAQGSQSRLEFSFPINIDTFDFIVLKAEVSIFSDDDSRKPFMQLGLSYANGENESVKKFFNRVEDKRNVRLRFEKDSTKHLDRLYGYLMNHKKCKGQKHSRVKNVRLYLMKYPIKEKTQSILEDTVLLKDTINIDTLHSY